MGEKDFQQVAVLTAMLKDFNLDCRIVPCPIVREADGLAMSSRNVFLTAEERGQALCLSRAISLCQMLYAQGERNTSPMIDAASLIISQMGGKLDYIHIVDPASLQAIDIAEDNSRIILAVFIGKTRLIDNSALKA
jgi:pantoate--beta-alanine ligase